MFVPGAEILRGRRIVATPAAIDGARLPADAVVLRIAPDDALIVGDGPIEVSDPHSIIESDAGWCALKVSEERALTILSHHAAWEPPPHRPVLAQGMVAGLAAKVYLDGSRSMVIVATPFAAELEERLS
ncbi:MAG TPA: hypothetical protein VJQ79_02180 [Acidimicrobiia bacterium]|nr:hypothetical protein [Acidimicrobiia bacterium]